MSRYEGLPVSVLLLQDGRLIRLTSPLTFHDAAGTAWAVPADATVDGASIPRPFWTVIGSPLTGQYRDASIVHDWYCDVRTRTWEATHRMFYEAMRASGVGEIQAKTMFYAVWWGGPRWEQRVSLNTNLHRDPAGNFLGFAPAPRIVDIDRPSKRADEGQRNAVAQRAAELIQQRNPSLAEIEALAELPGPPV